jgi:NAD(P)-dependent dehydrogenase (short-subunit alcohol dehydrogenase family)
MDAVIHNAGVGSGPHVLPVNVVAPYLLTALIDRPQRLVYLSSSMHRGGRASMTGMDWSGHHTTGSDSYSKLFVTTLAIAVARIWADVFSNAVDPGWVPTKMGGSGAPDDLRLGHLTQEWLVTSAASTHFRRLLASPAPRRAGPSVATSGSKTSCSRTSLASPPLVSPEPRRLLGTADACGGRRPSRRSARPRSPSAASSLAGAIRTRIRTRARWCPKFEREIPSPGAEFDARKHTIR